MTTTTQGSAMSDDIPEGYVNATFAGASPRHFPSLRLTVEPGGRYDIPQALADEYADVFRVGREPSAAKKAAADTTKEG